MDSSSNFDEVIKKLISSAPNGVSVDIEDLTPPPLNKEIHLSDNGKEIFNRRYRRKDENGNYTETIEETYMRVASHIAAAEEDEAKRAYYTNVFYNFLTNLEFIPNAPTWTGAGTPLGQLAACFVLPIEDDMGSHPDGIFSTLRNAALIQQTGGGNGFSFSRLRPKGAVVKSSMGRASGPVGFLEVFDTAFGEIAQGGVRRGANMAVLRVDHPDIKEFITCKTQEGKIKNFNISVAVTDKFMEAVKNDDDFDLINPADGKVWETVKAREIFDLMTKQAWLNGEPGILYIDEANRYNPVPNQYQLEATNPCGEQWLGPYENCCLGHINFAAHINEDGIDWEKLAKSTRLAVRFLDDIVTQNGYVPAVPQLREAAMRNRRIGLGFTGLADVLYKMKVRYGGEDGAEFAAQLVEFVRYHAMLASIDLAKERGPFPGIKGSIYDRNSFRWKIPKPLKPYTRDWGRPEIDWQAVRSGILEHGIRNSAQMTVAPTGSTSTVLGVEGYGCEPVFALAYERNVYQAAGQDEKLTLTYVSPAFQKELDKLDLSEERKKEIIEEIKNTGTCQNIKDLPEAMRNTFVVSADIAPSEHITMQASIQAFIDNSISKTCNFPNSATTKDIEDVYFQAWEDKCRGLTIYRAGSRDEIVLETKEVKESKKGAKKDSQATPEESASTKAIPYAIRPRPKILKGVTNKIETPIGNIYITVNKTDEGEYHETFITVGHGGSDIGADTEAIGRLISLIFRLGNANSSQRMKAVISELEGISSGMVSGFNGDRVLSIPDAIAKGLKKVDDPSLYSKQEKMPLFTEDNATKAKDEGVQEVESLSSASKPSVDASMCPICGNYSVMLVEGCKKCSPQLGGCGEYSEC